jgi:arginase family enzyme
VDWIVLDVPIDSSGSGRGEQRAPAALRAAGLLERLAARDGGVVDANVRNPSRDPASGVIAAAEIRQATKHIAAALRSLPGPAACPLVVGGDCTLLLGVFTAQPPGTGLWFVDGHPDFLDGHTSPTGEAADMDLSILTGHGPSSLVGTDRALVDPAAVDLVGHRTPTDESEREEAARIDRSIRRTTARQVRERGPARVGREMAARDTAPAWLHIDLDVLDAASLPAVTYPQPDGLDWDDLVALTQPLVRSGRLCGISVADFNPDLDPDGRHARRVVDALSAIVDR